MKSRISLLLGTLAALVALAGPVRAQHFYEPYHFTPWAGSGGESLPPQDGPALAARFANAGGITFTPSGDAFVGDELLIRKITGGVVSTVAGAPHQIGNADGPGPNARFWGANRLEADVQGNIFVADAPNQTIRKISPANIVSVLAGGDRQAGSTDGMGNAARFFYPRDVAVDSSGNVFVADEGNHTIRKITPDGLVTTYAGSAGVAGNQDGQGTAARFRAPRGVAVDHGGTVYVADFGNDALRKITRERVVSTVRLGPGFFMYEPTAVAVDSRTNLYLLESFSGIRKITPDGLVTVLADGFFGHHRGRDLTFGPDGSLYLVASNIVYRGVPASTVQFAATNYTAREDDAFAEVLLTLPEASAREVTVDWSTSDGTGRAGVDYVATSGTVTFLPGANIASLRVPLLNDSVIDGIKTVRLRLTRSSGVELGIKREALLTIEDNDSISFGTHVQVRENDHEAILNVIRRGDFETEATFSYATVDSADDCCYPESRWALPGVDYRPAAGTVSFAAGQSNLTVAFPLIDNGQLDGPREFFVRCSAGTVQLAYLTVEILDDEGPDTLMDLSFNPGLTAGFDDAVNALLVQPDGKILTGGRFDSGGVPGAAALARMNADGSRDSAFSIPDFFAGTDRAATITHLALQSNGQIVAAGDFTRVNGVARAGLCRLNSDGSVDLSFTSFSGLTLTNDVEHWNGEVFVRIQPLLKALAVQPDGKMLLAGRFSSVNGVGRTNVARLNPDGSLDSSLLIESELFVDIWPTEIRVLKAKTDGSLLLAGSSVWYTNQLQWLRPDGSVLRTYPVAGPFDGNGFVSSLALYRNGSVLAVGNFTHFDGAPRTNAVRILPDGSIDPDYRPENVDYSWLDGAPSIAVFDDQSLFLIDRTITGGFNDRYSVLYRILPDGRRDPAWQAISSPGWSSAIAATPDGKLLLGGGVPWSLGRIRLPMTGFACLFGNPQTSIVQFASTANPETGLYSTDIRVNEADGKAVVKVKRSGTMSHSVTVDYFTADGTAIEGMNYRAASGTISFSPGQSTAEFVVPIMNDRQLRGPGEFEVRLANASSGGVLGRQMARVRIDEAEIGFAPNLLARDRRESAFATLTGDYVWNFTGNITADSAGYLYASWQYGIHRIRPGGTSGPYAGDDRTSGVNDGFRSTARFGYIRGLAADRFGNVYVADSDRGIRKIDANGFVTTVAEGFRNPWGIAIDSGRNIFVTDIAANAIYRVSAEGSVMRIAGHPDDNAPGHADGPGLQARFDGPASLVIDSKGNLFVADLGNLAIRKISTDGTVSTFAGAPRRMGHADGKGGAARFSSLGGNLAIDAADNIYATDLRALRKIAPDGTVTTVAGGPPAPPFALPHEIEVYNAFRGVAVDRTGQIFVSKQGSREVQKISPALRFNVGGPRDGDILIEHSHDLLNWEPLAPTRTHQDVVEVSPPGPGKRFYRAKTQ